MKFHLRQLRVFVPSAHGLSSEKGCNLVVNSLVLGQGRIKKWSYQWEGEAQAWLMFSRFLLTFYRVFQLTSPRELIKNFQGRRVDESSFLSTVG